MKILLISNMYPSAKYEHFGTFVKNIEDQLIKNNLRVEHVVIDKKCSNPLLKIIFYFLFYIRILYNLIFFKYDSVYGHYVSHIALPLLIFKFFNKKIKLVVHVHGGDVKILDGHSSVFFKLKKYLSQLIFSKSDMIIVPSNYYRKLICDDYLVNECLIHTYPSGGVDTKLFNFTNVKRNKKVLGYAGRLSKSKNVDLIIKALLSLPDYKLDIVGSGEEKKYLMSLSKSLCLNDRINFIPSKNHVELSAWFKNLHCLIYPSSSESLGLVPIEAISSGVFTILSDIPAFRELSSTGVDLAFMRDLSPESITACVIKVESFNEEKRLDNSLIIADSYSSDKVTSELINVFK
ncbi:TPA: glycosyltransferase family 4 protein [Photobacterium damselae]